MCSHYDRAGLQLAAAVLDRAEFVQIFLDSYTDPRIVEFQKLLYSRSKTDSSKIQNVESKEDGNKQTKKEEVLKELSTACGLEDKMLNIHQNVTSSFSVLVDIFTNEAVAPFMVQIIHRGNKPYYFPEPIDPNNPKFYENSLRMSIQHILLALCPQQTAKVFEFANVFCNSDALIENVIDSCCEIDRKAQSLKLKPKVKDEIVSGVELAKGPHKPQSRYPWIDANLFLSTPPIMSKFQEDLNNSGVPIYQLSVRPPTTGITRHLRRKAYSDSDGDLSPAKFMETISNLSVILKSTDRMTFIVPLLQAIQIMADIVDWGIERPTDAIRELTAAILLVDPGQCHLVENFENNIANIFGEENNAKVSRAANILSAEVAQTEVAANQEKGDAIRTKFEEKKKRILDKIKKRQTTFFSGVKSQVQAESSRRGETDNQDNICSVSKVPLHENETYYMYAQCHFSNVKCDNYSFGTT